MKLRNLIEEAMDLLTTSKNHGHSHYAKVNSDGNGKTTKSVESHQHIIKNWKVLETEGHTHEIKKPARR